MKQVMIGIVLVIGVMTLGGCSTAPIGSQPDVVNEYPKVALNTESLAKAIKLNPAMVRKTDTGMLKVTQPLRAATDDVLYIEYRFIWKDATGQPVGPEMSWRYKRLEPRLNDYISANATSAKVTDYQVQLRWARK